MTPRPPATRRDAALGALRAHGIRPPFPVDAPALADALLDAHDRTADPAVVGEVLAVWRIAPVSVAETLAVARLAQHAIATFDHTTPPAEPVKLTVEQEIEQGADTSVQAVLAVCLARTLGMRTAAGALDEAEQLGNVLGQHDMVVARRSDLTINTRRTPTPQATVPLHPRTPHDEASPCPGCWWPWGPGTAGRCDTCGHARGDLTMTPDGDPRSHP